LPTSADRRSAQAVDDAAIPRHHDGPPSGKTDARIRRQITADIIDDLVADDGATAEERDDLVTSLVRQWTTYDGYAVRFLGGQLHHLDLARTPLGNRCVKPHPGPRHWLVEVLSERAIDLDLVPEIVSRLNVAQSAEVTAPDGSELRLWVNPREHTCGVDVLAESAEAACRQVPRDELARRKLFHRFGQELAPDEIDALAASVAEQWRRHDGHASVFVGPREQLHLVLRTRDDGRHDLFMQEIAVELDDVLVSLGFPVSELPAVIAKFNLGRVIDYETPDGVRRRLRHDPKARRIEHEKLPAKPAPAAMRPAITCRHCSALLVPSHDGSLPTICPLCGRRRSAS
jgi:hypothetical protein